MTATLARPDAAPAAAPRAPAAGRRLWLWLWLGALAVAVLLSIAVGAKPVPLPQVWDALFRYDPAVLDQVIVRDQRLPRTVLAIVVGCALAVAGALMQGMTRNPLADPGLLGVSAGASFAMTLAVAFLPITSLLGYIWFAFAGAVVATVAVYALGSAGGHGVGPLTLTLAGVSIGAVLSGLTVTLTLLHSNAFLSVRVWESGSLADRGWEVVLPVGLFVLAGLGFAAGAARGLNAVALGDDLATALGANARRTRFVVVVAVTLLCGAATAAIGPAWFVGLMVPHAARRFAGTDQRWLLTFCLVLGPVLMLCSDVLGRVVVRPDELQAGLITAFVGGPVLIWLARRTRMRSL
nr:iron chelate uptake ABC transporter family permease subunit [Propionicimonas sp.]